MTRGRFVSPPVAAGEVSRAEAVGVDFEGASLRNLVAVFYEELRDGSRLRALPEAVRRRLRAGGVIQRRQHLYVTPLGKRLLEEVAPE